MLSNDALEARRAYQRENQRKNRERLKEYKRNYQREWQRANPDKVRENQRRYWERKARKAAAAGAAIITES